MKRAAGRNWRAISILARERCAANTREAPNTFDSSSIMHPIGPNPMTQMLFPNPNWASSSPFTAHARGSAMAASAKLTPAGTGVTGPNLSVVSLSTICSWKPPGNW